jgi:hypothetical protein
MRRAITRAALALALLGAAAPAAADAASTKLRSCGGAGGKIDGPEGYEWGAMKIKASGVSCSTAKRHVRRCMASGKRPKGWRAGTEMRGGRAVSVLKRGSRRIQWEPVGGGGCGS